MSTSIEHSTGDWAEVLPLFGAGEEPPDRLRPRIDRARDAARRRYSGSGLPLPVPEALEHLIAGHTDSTAEYAGNSYQRALQLLVAECGSDTNTFATFSSPESLYRGLDEQLSAAGVPAELLPCAYLFGGPPEQFPDIPRSVDGYPALGHLPTARAGAVAAAYRAAQDRVDPAYRYELDRLTTLLELEDQSWVSYREDESYPRLTLFFYLG
ncbi:MULTISPECIES: hypothetical protein [Kitasatospora]|uniref:DUF7691 domain-containing protein n=1 Tax=Kitasatospora setae (strain ATCC 33774 / DSM 43861 / JCM 3304 / KCC A-0304 / NBRC 14216 / KM-6054) TaxID=452652 RepID=E4N743_KITSK|nr:MULTISPECIES: hypothetical protein [Kitasatospora]BAJ27024.1 hypothetical protein KSE_11910 [Kitasatospora setae KM-6054]